MTDEHPGTEELARRLEAYASVRLAPGRGAAARIRANVMEEARMRALEASLERPSIFGRGPRRRLVAILLAAGLVLTAAVGVAAASTAGGPLYGARVWVEAALLPADGNARALERIHQIDERVLEVERASQSGDSSGVAAAIAAYKDAVAAALAEVGSDGDRLAHLKAALGLHVVVLETLMDQAPPQAQNGLSNAIDSSQKAVTKLDATKPTAKPGGGPSSTDGPGHGGGPGHTPAPHPTPGHSPGP